MVQACAPPGTCRPLKDVFDEPLIQRCQQRKINNVKDKLPERLKAVAEKRVRQAYHAESALKPEGLLAERDGIMALRGARPGCSKPATSSAASTATCTCQNSGTGS